MRHDKGDQALEQAFPEPPTCPVARTPSMWYESL